MRAGTRKARVCAHPTKTKRKTAGDCVDEGCASWFDGCNTCNVGTDGVLACTRMACDPEKRDDAKCLDATEPDIVGGPTGDAKQDACCGGGSACGWTYCEALDKCVQEWETPCPPASTATEPGVVNYFDTVAKPANTDCNGGESVGVGCASGTTLSPPLQSVLAGLATVSK